MTSAVTPSSPPQDKDVYESSPEPAFYSPTSSAVVPLDAASYGVAGTSMGPSLLPSTSVATSHYLGTTVGRKTTGFITLEDAPIEPTVAYETFQGKTYKLTPFDRGFTTKMDFSDYEVMPSFSLASRQLTHRRRQPSGYPGMFREQATGVGLSQWPGMDQGGRAQLETPTQKLARLQMEIAEMQEFVSGMVVERDGTAETHAKKQGLLVESPDKLMAELKLLDHQIQGALQQSATRDDTEVANPISGSNDYGEVVKHLNVVLKAMEMKRDMEREQGAAAMEGRDGTAESGEAKTQENEKTVTVKGDDKDVSYELYCVPSVKPFIERSRISGLEHRLDQIERQVGVNRMSELPYPDIPTGIADLQSRLTLLDRSNLEGMLPKIKALNAELQGLQAPNREASLAVTGEEQTILGLYDMCERWKCATAALPRVIKRLRMLKTLHREAGGISARLSALEAEQKELSSLLDSTSANFDDLRDTVMNCLNWAKEAVEELHKRMETLA